MRLRLQTMAHRKHLPIMIVLMMFMMQMIEMMIFMTLMVMPMPHSKHPSIQNEVNGVQ